MDSSHNFTATSTTGCHQRHPFIKSGDGMNRPALKRYESPILSGNGGKSHGRAKSQANLTASENNTSPPANDGEKNFRHYLVTLGLPLGCLPAILKIYGSMESRIWIVDNSLEMLHKDSHTMIASGNFDRISKEDGASRWSELLQCVDFHIKMAARCWIPTKFWMVNKPNVKSGPQRFGVCWGDSSNWSTQREQALHVMKGVVPDQARNPLATEINKIKNRLEPEASSLLDKGTFVSVIVCTQGVPTNERGEKGSAILKDYLKSIVSLSSLPVKILFRICTNDDGVLEFYNAVDSKCDCDVLDDYWGEAMEVYLHNPWLTYGIGIHRIREAGLGTDLMDGLDEKAFSLEEIRLWCMEFFVGKSNIFMRHPSLDWNGFVTDLQGLLKKEKLVWNPVKNKLCHWVDVDKLNSMYRRNKDPPQRLSRARNVSMLSRSCLGPHDKQKVPPRNYHSSHPDDRRRTHNSSDLVREAPDSGHARKSTFSHEPPVREASESGHLRRSTFSHEPPVREALESGHLRSSTFSHEPPLREASESGHVRRSTSSSGECHSPAAYKRSSSPPVEALPVCSEIQDGLNDTLDLQQIIQRWSHTSPKFNKLRPLENLLVQVPTIFPPTNPLVEPHEYFDKWQEFSEDAFNEESGDGLKELLRRASRKAKFFLHPDKLPKDLTDNQALLLKSIWNVVQESEAMLT